jgi:predicted Zn-dependent peptidase
LEQICKDRPPTDDEMSETRKQEILSLAGRWETMNGQLSALTDLVWFGFPDEYWSQYTERIANVTSDEAQRAAQTLVHPGSMVWVIVGDRSRIESEVEALALGRIQHIDTEGNAVRAL